MKSVIRLPRCPERALVAGKMARCCRPVHPGSPADRHWAAGYGWQSFGGRDNTVRRDQAPPDCLVPVPPGMRRQQAAAGRQRGVRRPAA
jgi:hypothetical protein